MARAYKPPAKRRSKRTPPADAPSGTPAQQRELRAQGRRTMRRLVDAGRKVFAERGYHAARVDDIVRAARTSHGTFYLYFTNKEDLLRTLAIECAEELHALADDIGPVGPDEAGLDELRRFLAAFVTTYGRYGPVIRAWMEDQVADRDIDRLGVKAFTAIGNRLGMRIGESGAIPPAELTAAVGALMAMLERFTYALVSRRLLLDEDATLDTLARVVHRGFFGARATS